MSAYNLGTPTTILPSLCILALFLYRTDAPLISYIELYLHYMRENPFSDKSKFIIKIPLAAMHDGKVNENAI